MPEIPLRNQIIEWMKNQLVLATHFYQKLIKVILIK